MFAQEETYSLEELTGRVAPKDSENPYKLRGEVYNAFVLMQQAALKDSIEIEVISAYRSFAHQRRIWNNKFKKFTASGLTDKQAVQKILKYSTVPGTSRHHWGTDIDIVQKVDQKISSYLIASNFNENGPFYELKKWLDTNASNFGFEIIYTNDPNRLGFKYEPWHFTYMPTASKMLECYIEMDCFHNIDFENNMGHSALNKEELNFYFENHIKNP